MMRELIRYRGRIVDLVYLDRRGRFTRRQVRILNISGDTVRVFCLERQSPRTLRIENILALQLVIGRAG